jgi:hypothetical protein
MKSISMKLLSPFGMLLALGCGARSPLDLLADNGAETTGGSAGHPASGGSMGGGGQPGTGGAAGGAAGTIGGGGSAGGDGGYRLTGGTGGGYGGGYGGIAAGGGRAGGAGGSAGGAAGGNVGGSVGGQGGYGPGGSPATGGRMGGAGGSAGGAAGTIGPDGGSAGAGGKDGGTGGSAGGKGGGAGGGTVPNGGSIGTGGTIASGGTVGTGGSSCPGLGANEELIDDLDDGDRYILPAGGRVGSWTDSHDPSPAGTMFPDPVNAFTPTKTDNSCRKYVAYVKGSGFSDWGADFWFGLGSPYNASKYTGISFWAKVDSGTTSVLRVSFPDKDTFPDGGICQTNVTGPMQCFDHYGSRITLGTDWKKYTVTFSQVTQDGWGHLGTAFDPASLYEVLFEIPVNATFSIYIDDVAFIR